MPNDAGSDKKVKYKAGIFIIFTIALLLFSILWLRYFAILPDKIITVKFGKTGPISEGLPVYYQGVDIGKVTNIGFSSNYRYTLVELSIYRKHMCLPANVYAEVDMEGITGQNYINIIYPDKPVQKTLQTCSTIEGKPSDIDQVREVLGDFVKSGEFERTFDRLNVAVANISKASTKMDKMFDIFEEMLKDNRGDIRDFVHNAALSANNVQMTTSSLKGAFISSEVKSAVTNISGSSKKFGGIVDNINKITGDVNKVTGDPRFQEGIIKTFQQAGGFAESLNSGELKCLIDKTLSDTDRTVNRYDCMGQSLNDMMSERFLLMKLIFGTPGRNFKKCNNLNCIEGQISK